MAKEQNIRIIICIMAVEPRLERRDFLYLIAMLGCCRSGTGRYTKLDVEGAIIWHRLTSSFVNIVEFFAVLCDVRNYDRIKSIETITIPGSDLYHPQ